MSVLSITPSSHRIRGRQIALTLLLVAAESLSAQAITQSAADRRAAECASCAEWNVPQRPFRVYGNTYYVGTHGLGAILITSPAGHVLIDGALPESAAGILASIRALGFRVEDVKQILNSHAHFDHGGGIAAIARATGAMVAASPWSASVLENGFSSAEDPQFGVVLTFPAVDSVRRIRDGDTIRVGSLDVVAHFTAGHTPGGTTWTWRSCEGGRCLDLVYADSQTPVSADGFHFTRSRTYPSAVADFRHGFAVLDSLRCDILLTPHPGASGFWDRVAARDSGKADALIDRTACRALADGARKQLAARLATEAAKRP